MPPPDAPPDFAALWANYKNSRAHMDSVIFYSDMRPHIAAYEEYTAARALLDALTGDATLRELGAAYFSDPKWENCAEYSDLIIERLVGMGMLHGPESETAHE